MNDEQLHTLADLQAFLAGTVAMNFTVTVDQRYEFIARTVRRFGYARLKRADKAVVLRFLERVSGYSRQQLTRLVRRGCERRKLVKRPHLARARELLHVAPAIPKTEDASDDSVQPTFVCPDCGAAMIVIETMTRAPHIRAPPQLRGAP